MTIIKLYTPQCDDDSGRYHIKYTSQGKADKAAVLEQNPSQVPKDYHPNVNDLIPDPKYLTSFVVNDQDGCDLTDVQTCLQVANIAVNQCLQTIYRTYPLPPNVLNYVMVPFVPMIYKGLIKGIFDLNGIENGLQATAKLFAELADEHNSTLRHKLLGVYGVSAYSLFIVALMVSEKHQNDYRYDNKTWSKLTHLPLPMLNAIERSYLEFQGLYKTSDNDWTEAPVVFSAPPALQRNSRMIEAPLAVPNPIGPALENNNNANQAEPSIGKKRKPESPTHQ